MIASRLAAVEDVGALPGGGVTRLAWTPEASAMAKWFAEQAASLGLSVTRDGAGNLWALPEGDGPWWALGSHLDSVRAGGRFDGPLGVAAAFEVCARSSLPLAVIAFADEEGARFNTPTFGSRALAGRLDVEDALSRVDDDGVTLAHASGLDAASLAAVPDGLSRLRGFLELHIDQSLDAARLGVPVVAVGALASRMRVQVTLRGAADHAGTTPYGERRDALSAAARLIFRAEDACPAGGVVTATRLRAEPDAATTIPSRVSLWLDARAIELEALDAWFSAVAGFAADGIEVDVVRASRSPGGPLDAGVRAAFARAGVAHEVTCFAGHDAAMLDGRLPTGMLLVRNRSGVSHAPEEHVSLDDAEAALAPLLAAVTDLAGVEAAA